MPEPRTLPSQPSVWTVAEVAAALRCSKAHVHNLINGKVHGAPLLPSIQLGRRRLVRLASLMEWLEISESRVGMIRSSPDIDAADA